MEPAPKAAPAKAAPIEVQAASGAPPSAPIVRVDLTPDPADTFGKMLDRALALRPR